MLLFYYLDNINKMKYTVNMGILKLDNHYDNKEIDFELNYILSLTIKERFLMMKQKSQEMQNLLYNHENRSVTEIIKRI